MLNTQTNEALNRIENIILEKYSWTRKAAIPELIEFMQESRMYAELEQIHRVRDEVVKTLNS